MVLKLGSKGRDVKDLQEFLGIKADGVFGKGTEKSVKNFQKENNLVVDGIVGQATIEFIGLVSTDNSESIYTTNNGLLIHNPYLPKGAYKEGNIDGEWLRYFNDGKLIEKKFYRNGKLIKNIKP